MDSEITILDDEAWDRFCDEGFSKRLFDNEEEEEVYRVETYRLQNLIRDRLGKKWKGPDDFEVGYNWNHYTHYYNCGGIYSERAFCWDYVKIIMTALESAKHPELTSYHTVCEIIVNPDGKTAGEMMEDWGEFYITNGKLLIKEGMAQEYITRLTDKTRGSLLGSIKRALGLQG